VAEVIVLTEEHDRWIVPMAGATVEMCKLDYAFTLVATASGSSTEVRLEQPFELQSASDETALTLDPESDPAALAPALRVLHQVVTHAFAFKDGRLELMVGDIMICAGVSRSYEAWSITGPDGLRVVSLPGGSLAVWKAEPDERGSRGD
jgi:Family of unknown function (DUF6188)